MSKCQSKGSPELAVPVKAIEAPIPDSTDVEPHVRSQEIPAFEPVQTSESCKAVPIFYPLCEPEGATQPSGRLPVRTELKFIGEAIAGLAERDTALWAVVAECLDKLGLELAEDLEDLILHNGRSRPSTHSKRDPGSPNKLESRNSKRRKPVGQK